MTEKWDLLLRSLRLFTSLLLKWNLYLHLLHSFTSLLLKWKNLCTFNTLFHFTTIKIKLSTLNTLFYFTTIKVICSLLWLCSLRCVTSLLLTREMKLLSLRCSDLSSIFFPRNFSVSLKFVCETVISPPGSSVES